MWTSCALHFFILEVTGETVSRIRLDGNQLIDSCVPNARAIKSNLQRTPACVVFARVETQMHTRLLLILPIEACIQHCQIEVAIHYQILTSSQVGAQFE